MEKAKNFLMTALQAAACIALIIAAMYASQFGYGDYVTAFISGQ